MSDNSMISYPNMTVDGQDAVDGSMFTHTASDLITDQPSISGLIPMEMFQHPVPQAPKKKRGRPLGSKNKPKTVEAKTVSDIEVPATVELPKKKRGRPPGSKNKTKAEKELAAKIKVAKAFIKKAKLPSAVELGIAPKKKKASKKAPKAKKLYASAALGGTTGQSAPAIDGFEFEELNAKEIKVMMAFDLEGERETLTISQMAKNAWPTNTQGKSNSWTRNSLRRLVRCGFIEKLKRGEYRISIKGRNRAVKNAAVA